MVNTYLERNESYLSQKNLVVLDGNQRNKTLSEILTPKPSLFYVEKFSEALVLFDQDDFSEEQVAFFVNLKNLIERAKFFKENFLNGDPAGCLAYAVKANPDIHILDYLIKGGVESFDCASLREIALVKNLDLSNQVFFNHPIKKKFEISRSFSDFDVRHFTVQSMSELDKVICSLPAFCDFSTIEIAVRLKTKKGDSKIDLASKFGVSIEEAKQIMSTSSKLGFKVGVSVHTGSQNVNPLSYKMALDDIELLVSELEVQISTINLGGGFPINYEGSEFFDERRYFEIVNSAVDDFRVRQRKHLKNTRYILEIGRALVAGCSKLVVPILSKQVRNGESCLYLADGVFGSFSDYAVHSWRYNFQILRGITYLESVEDENYRLYGPTCDSGDQLGVYTLPAFLNPETDRLLVDKAGAYMASQSSDFNFMPHARQVFYNA